MLKKILLSLGVSLVIAQFIRPEKNLSDTSAPGPADITVLHPTPPAVKATLERACYDCHSNHTHYPWYAEIQPVGWWLANHIDEGKAHLNFSEFGHYDAKRATRKMKQLVDDTREGEMPLGSYLLIHRDAALSAADLDALEAWADTVRERVAAAK